jgi:hypothetical protein
MLSSRQVEKMAKMFDLIKRSRSCVLLQYVNEERYIVKDIENDIICSTTDYETAERMFNGYDINKVRKDREDIFERWLKVYTE